MTKLARIVLPLALGLSIQPALAAGVPSQLHNKTVAMSWSTSGTAKTDGGDIRNFTNINSRSVYISSAGRTFLRKQVSSTGRGRIGREAEIGPGEGGGGGSVRFEGNRLVGVESFMSGARQYVATFDASFSSCSLSVIDAKSGNAAIRRRGPDGGMYEVTSVSTGSPSCSIQSGNTVGGQ